MINRNATVEFKRMFPSAGRTHIVPLVPIANLDTFHDSGDQTIVSNEVRFTAKSSPDNQILNQKLNWLKWNVGLSLTNRLHCGELEATANLASVTLISPVLQPIKRGHLSNQFAYQPAVKPAVQSSIQSPKNEKATSTLKFIRMTTKDIIETCDDSNRFNRTNLWKKKAENSCECHYRILAKYKSAFGLFQISFTKRSTPFRSHHAWLQIYTF